ncbi:hypothetical protein ILYODFUR_008515 [Ilyodon furcidens]|uniref:Uncharacterized protein n=1 Tax=Ilyodon furcidens TaxID=33524 RepID=A0ABV0UEK2_9TELE
MLPYNRCHWALGPQTASKEGEVSCPRAGVQTDNPQPNHKRNLSTLQRKPPHIELVYCNLSSTEQHQVNSLRIYLLKTWILNLIAPGDLTTITHPRKQTNEAEEKNCFPDYSGWVLMVPDSRS